MSQTYDKAAIATSVARMLLEIKAVLFRADDPFTLTSGMKSPRLYRLPENHFLPTDALANDGLWQDGHYE